MDAQYTIARYPTELIDRLRHANGAMLTLRPVLPQDGPALQAFVAALSPEARHDRFHVGLARLSAAMTRYFVQVDYRRHLGLVAERLDGDGPPVIVADARYVGRDDRPDVAETAVMVADGYRGRGLGTRLVEMLVHAARRAGFAAMDGEVLSTNQRMLALLGRLGFRFRRAPGDARLVMAELALRERAAHPPVDGNVAATERTAA